MTEDQTLGFQKIIIDCVGKESPTKDDFDEFFTQKNPSTKTSKCFRACLSETLGSVSISLRSVAAATAAMNILMVFFCRIRSVFLLDKRQ